MSTQHPTAALEDRRLPVQAKLAAAWASFMFLYLYVDYLHLYRPGTVDRILDGRVFEFTVSPPLLTGFLALIAAPSVMVALSVLLPARANRITQLVVASLYIPVTAFNAVGESWEWTPFYTLSIGIELALLALILLSAAKWPRGAVAQTAVATPGLQRQAS